MSDLLDFLKEIDENPDLRAAAFLRSLGRLRDEIDRVPEEAPMDSPVVLKLQGRHGLGQGADVAPALT